MQPQRSDVYAPQPQPQPHPQAQPHYAPAPVAVPPVTEAHHNPLTKKPHHKVGGFFKRWWWLVLLIVVLVAVVGFLGYSYLDARNKLAAKNSTPNTAEAASDELEGIIKEISKYMELPKETPALATISDVSKVKQQEFFKNAQNGDKVLIFSKAGRGLLWRPSTHKIIEYTKVDISSEQASQPITNQ